MGRMGQESSSDYKNQLVLEICSISTRSIECVHRLLSKTNEAPFVDWYCILGVEENAALDSIRRQYHKLALQLHPDKNKHPKAEIAFKLLSEAYTCLSDAAKRKAFNLERHKSFCFQCNRIPYGSTSVPPNSNKWSTLKSWNTTSRSRSSKLWRNIRDIREKLREESKVIENCLRENSMPKKESPLYNPEDYLLHRSRAKHNRVEKETPVFNPSNYLGKGYPHVRDHVYKNSEACWYLEAEIKEEKGGGAKYTSPIFEIRTQRSMFARKFVPVPSQC